MALSFDQICELVRTAIMSPAGGDKYCYIVEMYDDAVVYELDDLLYRRTYAIVDDQVTLGEPVQVKKQVEYFPLQAASRILAAVGDPSSAEYGYQWRVQVIEYGPGADGRINWPREPLVAAIGLYDGARVFALNESQHQAGGKPFGKSVREIVGWLKNPQDTGTAIEADFFILKSARWLRDGLVDSHERGNPTLFGLSHDVTGKAVTKMVAGKKMKEPTAISAVEVDVVYNPTNNGQFLRMVAAQQAGQKEDDKMLKKLLAALQSTRPELHEEINKGLTAGTITEDQALQMVAAATVKDAGGDEGNEKLVAAVVARLKEVAVPIESADMKEMKLLACSLVLDRELTDSKLPEAAAKTIRGQFEGKAFETTELQAAIKSTKEMLDSLTASGMVMGVGETRVTVDSLDKAGQYLDDFFEGKVHSFKAAYQDITGDLRITGELRDAKRLQAAIATTTFDQILGDSLTRRMVAEYNLAGLDDWKKVVTIVPLNDFRQQRRPRMGGYGNLPAVNQSGAYNALTSPADEEATYTPSKRGGTESITLETIRNDDVGVIRRIPIKLGRAAARTLYVFVFDFFATNPTLYDTVAFFHATHGNLATVALSKTQLQAGRLQIMKQTEAGSSEVLGIPPKYLLVPPDLEDSSFELTAGPVSGLITLQSPDSVRRQTYETIVVKTWTDVNNWYLTCDPNDIPGIEIGFLDGRQDPELFVQDLPNVGSMFSNDQLTYKIRHIYGGAVVDYRGSQGNVVA